MEESGINYSSLVEESLMRQFWEKHWKTNNLGWDIGYPSPPIVDYMQNYANKDAAILIPGCGNAYEAEYLLKNGFKDISLIDISPTAVDRLNKKFKDTENVKIFCADFFAHQRTTYDLIIEQTFFCALNPEKRLNYVNHTADLLKDGGKLIGLLFGVEFPFEGPPFGGDRADYEKLFKTRYHLRKLKIAENSIKPREGNELFIEFEKKGG